MATSSVPVPSPLDPLQEAFLSGALVRRNRIARAPLR
jgi:hypothetical protein